MAVEPRLMTAAELERLPDDGQRHELVRGELRTMAPSSSQHARTTSRFDRSLGNHVEAHDLGEVLTGDPGFLLTVNPDTVRAPDSRLSGVIAGIPWRRSAASGSAPLTWQSRSSHRTISTRKSKRRSPTSCSMAHRSFLW